MRFHVEFIVLISVVDLLRNVSSSTNSQSHEFDPPEVDTDSGPVRGFRYQVPDLHTSGTAFLGIPYAKPPVGHMRFKSPEPVEKWNEIFNATSLPNSCYQLPDYFFGNDFPGSNMWNPNTRVSEDCLYLNVWVPQTRRSCLPVMVWIYGGGFYGGTSTLEVYDGRILASLYNVVVVSIGYRVGVLGFLCLDHPDAPCNVGLFDQVLALDWIQHNIKYFEGDARNVTLFGESAGAASIGLHLLSPISWDKFDRAILQSGSANMPWATLSLSEARRRSIELARDYIKCGETDDIQQIIDCLRATPARQLVEEQWVSRYILQFPFLPAVDGKFVLEDPEAALRKGRFKNCPILVGSNLNEGSWFLMYELSDLLKLDSTRMTKEDFHDGVNRLFYSYPQYPERMNSTLALEAIQFLYTNWLKPDEMLPRVRGLEQAVGDFHFVCPINRFAQYYSEAGNRVYMYQFTERYRSSPWPTWTGVLHGDEILFVFGQPLKQGANFTGSEKQFSRSVMKFWTNFIKTSDPNLSNPWRKKNDENERIHPSHWPVHTVRDRYFVELNSRYSRDVYDMKKAARRGLRSHQCAFWSEYLPKLISNTAGMGRTSERRKLESEDWTPRHPSIWNPHAIAVIYEWNLGCTP